MVSAAPSCGDQKQRIRITIGLIMVVIVDNRLDVEA
jgi:hypothetical protein